MSKPSHVPPSEACWVGIDPGLARCGVAVADSADRIAFPLCALDTEPRATLPTRLLAALAHRAPKGLAIGLPLDPRGQEGPAAAAAREIGELLSAAVGVAAVYVDERFTSRLAERQHKEMRPHKADVFTRHRREKPSPPLDAEAAALILRAHLDALAR